MNYALVQNLINASDFSSAESILKNNPCNDPIWHYLYSKVFLSKQWFDKSLNHLKIACDLDPDNYMYNNELINFLGRCRRYSENYYKGGYRHRKHGCSCCCCDCNFSCCELICLDSCCECMGGDLINCI